MDAQAPSSEQPPVGGSQPASDTAPGGAQPAGASPATGAEPPAGLETEAPPAGPGFGERGRMRRRVRFLRKARELGYRDLGGLVFEMHRLGQRHDELAAAKLAMLTRIDTELQALDAALGERRALTVLREAGIAACPRCAAIHGSEDRFCPSCGLAMGRQADRPIASAPAPAPVEAPAAPAASPPAAPPPPSPPPPSPTPTPAPTPAPTPTPAPASEAQAPETSHDVHDDRPTEIIRPPEREPGGGA